MLLAIREKISGWVAAFILTVIALSLVVTFGNIDTGFTGGTLAASVNGEDIPMTEFQRVFQNQQQQWEINFQEAMPPVLASAMADSVIQDLISNRLLISYARNNGYRVSDREVINEIEDIAVFNVGNQFSQSAYEQALASIGYSPQQFEYEKRQEMQLRQFQEGIQKSAFFTPQQFRRYIELDAETRSVRLMLLPSSYWLEKVSLDSGAEEIYYNENQSAFQTEESADIEYIEVNYNDIIESIEVSDVDAESYFSNNLNDFLPPDDRRISHILIKEDADTSVSLNRIIELRELIANGVSFEQIARENSVDSLSAAKGGDLGWLGSGEMPAPEFDTALETLSIGGISQPVKTQYGYHLIKLVALRQNRNISFSDVRDEILARLKEDRAIDLYDQLVDELDELALESLDGLKPVAEAMGLPLKQQLGFSRTEGLPLGNQVSLSDAVFSMEVLEDRENSQVIQLQDGRAIVLSVTGFNPSATKTFNQVREQIKNLLKNNKAIIMATSRGDELVNELQSGAKPEDLIAEDELVWQFLPSVRRVNNNQLSAELVSAIFNAPRPRDQAQSLNYQGLLLQSGDFAIYQVAEVTPGSPQLFDTEARDQRKKVLADQVGYSQLNALVSTLNDSADVSITPDLLGEDADLL
ncbi:MAG: SurA N-terminal domain-containing protein [Pseudomonadota bacterium]|nr:SurA N-terminal domain-containing protein [Pseudomonadota bacterium]